MSHVSSLPSTDDHSSSLEAAALQLLPPLLSPPLNLSPNEVVFLILTNPSQPLALVHGSAPPLVDSSTARGGPTPHSDQFRSYLWYISITMLAGSALGYHIGVSGGVTSMAPFLEKFFPEVHRNDTSTNQYCKFNSQKLQLFTSSLYLAALFASLGASWVTKKLGHRIIMVIVGFMITLGSILTCAAVNIAMLIGGRFLIGIGIGFAYQTMPIHLSEMTPSKHHRFLNVLFQLTIIVGIVQANAVNFCMAHAKVPDNFGWRFSLGGGVNLLLIIYSFSLSSETPNSLVEKGRYEEAKALLKRIHGVKANVEVEFNNIVAAMKESRLVQSPWKNLVNKKCYRPQLAMSILIPLFQQFAGINVIIFYGPLLFQTIGFERNTSHISAIVIGIAYLLAILILICGSDRWGSDRWGRRSLFLESGIQMFIFQMAVAVLIGWRFLDSTNIPSWSIKALVTCIFMYVVAFPWSWGPLGWFYPSEIFPLEVRSAAQTVAVAVNMLAAFIIGQFFVTMFCTMQFGVFIFFAFVVVLMTMYCYIFMPEAKNMPVEDMTEVWRHHWFWRRYMNDTNDRVDEDIVKNQLNVSFLEINP